MRPILASMVLFLLADAAAADAPSDSSRRVFQLHGFPYAYYTPETNWAFGGILISTFRPGADVALKPSSAMLDAFYTANTQFKFSFLPEVYLTGNRFLISGTFSYGRFVDRYWGIGPYTDDSDSAEFVRGTFQFQVRGETLLLESLKCGLLIEFERLWMADKEQNTLLRQSTAAGTSGGTSSGTGIALSWDTRDNIYYPSAGSFHQVDYTFFGAFAGSDFTYQRGTVDLRTFFSFGKHIFGIQGWGMMVRGTPPFYRLAPLGGDLIMRGYYLGRFRDNYSVAAQFEYRAMILEPIGVAAFLGCGEVAPAPAAFNTRRLLPSYGAGLRYMLDETEKLTVRIDLGFGKGTNGVYLAVREAF